jgi:hypothetical protein
MYQSTQRPVTPPPTSIEHKLRKPDILQIILDLFGCNGIGPLGHSGLVLYRYHLFTVAHESRTNMSSTAAACVFSAIRALPSRSNCAPVRKYSTSWYSYRDPAAYAVIATLTVVATAIQAAGAVTSSVAATAPSVTASTVSASWA